MRLYGLSHRKPVLLLILMSSLLLSLGSIHPVKAQNPSVYLTPATNTVLPGNSFSLDIMVDEFALDVFAWEAKLKWNQTILEFVSWSEGPYLSTWYVTSTAELIENPLGKAMVGVFISEIPAPSYGVDGPGKLGTVTFMVEEIGTTVIDLVGELVDPNDPTSPDPYGTKLVDHTGALIWLDGLGDSSQSFEIPLEQRFELTGHGAWPEHHHFGIAKDEDHIQNLTGKVVSNQPTGGYTLKVKVVFNMVRVDIGWVGQVHSEAKNLAPGDILTVKGLFKGTVLGSTELNPAVDVGKYSVVEARAYLSFAGNLWYPGTKVKTFSFSVVP